MNVVSPSQLNLFGEPCWEHPEDPSATPEDSFEPLAHSFGLAGSEAGSSRAPPRRLRAMLSDELSHLMTRDAAPIDLAIEGWHRGMPTHAVRDLRSRLQDLSSKPIEIATACSGSDVLLLVLNQLIVYWSKQFGVSLSCRHVFSCERDKDAQAFLLSQFPRMEALIENIRDLDQEWAPTIHGTASGLLQMDKVDIFAAGFSCKARSKLNCNRAAADCVQNGTACTGETFSHLAAYISRHRPRCVLLENVSDLAEVSETGISDSDYIVQFFLSIGYVCRPYPIEARKYGSLPRRFRLYWLAFESGAAEYLDVAQQTLDAMADTVVPRPIEDYLLPVDCHQVQNRKKAVEMETREYKWKTDHANLFDLHNLVWPPSRDLFDQRLSHLDQRPYECVCFASMRFPYTPAGRLLLHAEYLDVNESLGRAVGPDGTTNPWKHTMPTMVCHGLYILRRGLPTPEGAADYKVDVRQLDGAELLGMLGFAAEHMVGGYPPHEVATSLAGNAFSGFAAGAMLVSAFRRLRCVAEVGLDEGAEGTFSDGGEGPGL